MARISDEKIEEVRAAVDLVDVVGDYVRLKKQGSRFVGLCPFHSEKTPSFHVVPDKQFFHCFGCKKSGDTFRFVEEVESVSFLDAVRLLAAKAGITLPEEDEPAEDGSEKDAILAALRFAAKFYFDQLRDPSGKRGLDYLRSRGFSAETIKAFGLGYAPDAWDALARAAEAAHFRADVLEAAGLTLPNTGRDGQHDRFRDRAMFPILSPAGKVLGFGGRVIPGGRPASDDYDPPKYINTPETKVYHKGDVLFGLRQAKTPIRGEEEAILVEGYADVISLHQAGIKNVVAASGTALTAQQVRALGRYARRVVLLFDADGAGQAAALRSIGTCLAQGLAPYLLTLPDGTDPDSFVRDVGAEAFREYLRAERTDFVAFMARHARRSGLLGTAEGVGQVARDVLDLVALIEDPVAQDQYVLRAGAELGVPDSALRPQLRERLRTKSIRPASPSPDPLPPVASRNRDEEDEAPEEPTPILSMRPEEEELLRLMLEHGDLMVEHVLTRMALEEFSAGPVRETVVRLVAQFEAGGVTAAPFLEGEFGPEVRQLAARVLADRHAVSEEAAARKGLSAVKRDAEPYKSADGSMKQLKLDRLSEAIAAEQRRAFLLEQAGEDLTAHQRTLQDLLTLREQIKRGGAIHWSEGEQVGGQG